MAPAQDDDPQARQNHGKTEQLTHAQHIPDKPQLKIRLPVKLDEKTDSSIADGIEGQLKTGKGSLLSQYPEENEEDDPFKKSLV